MRKHTALFLFAAVAASLLAASPVAAQADVICDGRVATIVGTPEDDTLLGTPGDDVIFAAQGDDRIDGRGGDDVICAGKGDDVVQGGDGFDILFGAQGNDLLFATNQHIAERMINVPGFREDTAGARMFGGAGNDHLFGSDRWDRMQGGPGTDHLYGFEGRDWLRGGPDRDFVFGGLGIDDLHGGNGSDRITVTNGDSVRGGNGADMCVIGGPAELLVSCGRNRFEPGIAQRTLPGGTYAIPSEIQNGFWRTTTFFSLEDANGNIVTNDFAANNGPTIAVVDPRGASVELRGQATRVEAAGPVNMLGRTSGRALVGMDLAPGQYRITPLQSDRNAIWSLHDGNGTLLTLEAGGVGISDIADVPPEAVFFEWSGTLERVG